MIRVKMSINPFTGIFQGLIGHREVISMLYRFTWFYLDNDNVMEQLNYTQQRTDPWKYSWWLGNL